MSRDEAETLINKITEGVSKAVKNAIEEHFKRGDYVLVMQNGKLTKLYPPKKPQ